MFKKIQLLFNTVKYLKAGQILNRVKRKFIKPKVSLQDIPENSHPHNKIKPIVQCSQRMFGERSFKFLNKEFTLKTSEDWNAEKQDKLWLYNLHYFDDLNAVNFKQRATWHTDLIQKWIDENPVGFCNGWEPYPSSLRIVNWIKWSLLGGDVKKDWHNSLAVQIRYLSQNLEYHLLGNHLFANAKALIFAGLYFQGGEADDWYKVGVNILNRELPEQVLDDGGNFELSPMYHAIFLEDLLDIINLHRTYEKQLPNGILDRVPLMLDWLNTMSHPDGDIAFFNDSALGIAPSFVDLTSYAKRLGVDYKDQGFDGYTHLKESGYIRFNSQNLVVIADIAQIGPSYMPGHGHADALSFEASLFGKRVIVNSGISTYETGSDRNVQRGTLSHSTISINDTNSSEVWGGFRVARRAKIFNIKNTKSDGLTGFSACHDGYIRIKGRSTHCREWIASNNLLEIVDTVSGSGKHKISSVLPLHPEVVVSDVKSNFAQLEVDGKKVEVSFEGEGSLVVKESLYHPEFGISMNNKQLIYSYNGVLPFKSNIKISW